MSHATGGRSVDAQLFWAAAGPVLAVGAVLVLLATVVAGGRGAVGAALGVVLVAVFFGAGLLAARWTRRSRPTTVMGVAMATYLLKITLLALFLVLFRGTELFDARSFAAGVIGCGLVWLAAEVRAVGRMRVPLDVEAPSAPEPDRQG